jgi:hypothetical protein
MKYIVVVTFREADKGSPVPQQMLKMPPSGPNALNTTAEDVTIYCLEFFCGNCWNLTA